ncbi:MAG: MotA/TolQ/ExbB proton channel family protein [Rhodothermales bacterium]
MLDLFYAGGQPFMSILTLLAIGALVTALKKGNDLFLQGAQPGASHTPAINLVLQLGLLAFFMGILAQAIGLFEAFQAIEAMGGVSPAMLAGGLRVSMIAPVYGLIILILSFTFWAVLRYRNEPKSSAG